MPEIRSLVFFDLETTGLPYKEKNQTKIIELSFVSTSREHLEVTPRGFVPPVKKLTFLLNPQRQLSREVSELTGISSKEVANAPTFQDKIRSIILFLEDLPKPVCLVAHNGNTFDFKILLAECNDISVRLPDDVLCVDSLIGIRRILKCKDLPPAPPQPTIEDLLTDDEGDEWPDLNISKEDWNDINLDNKWPDLNVSKEDWNDIDLDDEWPDLNVSKEDWEEIDLVSLSVLETGQQISHQKEHKSSKLNTARSKAIKNVFNKGTSAIKVRESLKLTDIYKRLLNNVVVNAHRAEEDCMMLLKCVVTLKEDFLPWADNNCKLLTEIKPLVRGPSTRMPSTYVNCMPETS